MDDYVDISVYNINVPSSYRFKICYRIYYVKTIMKHLYLKMPLLTRAIEGGF